MKYTKLLQSSLGTFATRIGLSISTFLGVFYLAAQGPVVLGVYSLFAVVIHLFNLLTDAGFTSAAEKRISEGNDRDEFFTTALVVRLSLFVPVALVVIIFRQQISAYVGLEMVVPFLLAGAFASLVRRTLEAGLVGEKKVARAGFVKFTFPTGQLIAWVVLVSLGYGLFGVLLGYVIGQVLAVGVGLVLFTFRPQKPTSQCFQSLFQFAKYSWISAVTTKSWVWTDTLILGLFVVPALVGIYELSWQITGVLFLLSSAISSTLFATVSDLSARGEVDQITDLLERSLVYTGIIAIPGLVGGIIFAKPILAIFGEEYRIGAMIVPVLILARVLHSYEVVFGKVIDALNRPDLTLRANATFIVVNIVLNIIAIAMVGWIGAAFATAAAMILKTGLAYRYIRSILTFTIPVREIFLEGVAALIMGGCLWVLLPTSAGTLSVLETILLVGFSVVIYAVALLVLVERIRVATARAMLP